MFIESSGADNAMSILQSAFDAFIAKKGTLSEFDQKIKDAISDAIGELYQKPFNEYSDVKTAVANYVMLRDMLGINRKAWEEFEEMTKSEMTRISMFLRDIGDQMGVDSFNTPYGTAYRNTKRSYRIEDWDSFAKWMRDTDNMQCVEKRAAKLAVKDVFDEIGELPPGLSEFVEVEFNVRRPTKGKQVA